MQIRGGGRGGRGPASAPSPGALCPPLSPRPRILKGPRGLRSRAWNPTSRKPSGPQRSAPPGDPPHQSHLTDAEGPVVRVPSASVLSPPAWQELPPTPPHPRQSLFVRGLPRAASLARGGHERTPRARPRRRFTLGIRASPLHEPWRWEPGSAFYGVGGGVGSSEARRCASGHTSELWWEVVAPWAALYPQPLSLPIKSPP